MNQTILYLVDDKEESRHANGPILQKFLGSPNIKVVPLEPFPEYAKYDELLRDPSLGGFFIDQKMRGSGVVNYNGIELAEHLRGMVPKLPIYILTGYPNEDFTGTAYRVEDILDKEVIEDSNSEEGHKVQARILRRLNVFEDVLNEREQRFHELLVKSLKKQLTSAEEKEIGLLEAERLAPQHASELRDVKALEKAISELRSKMQDENLNL